MRTMTRQSGARRAFTLVELLVVMSVIAILMSLLVPTLNAIRGQVNETRVISIIEGVSMALEQYKQTFYTYPPDRMTGKHADLDKSSECLVYCLSGASIAYNPSSPPANYPWQHTLFQDSSVDGSARRAMTIFYQFKENTLADQDKDKVPELIDPWQHRLVYNSGAPTSGTFPDRQSWNQYSAPFHNLKKFDIISAGRDGKFGTSDDLKNWKDSLSDKYNMLSTTAD